MYFLKAQLLSVPFGRIFHSSFTNYCTEGQKIFTLYTTENCGLCSYFKKRLVAFHTRTKPDWNYVEKNLANEPREIFEKYKHDIPVLVYKDKLLLKHRFSANELRERLLDIFPES